MNCLKTLIIIPCYNEALRLPSLKFQEFSTRNPYMHFLFVNDGSRDKTQEALTQLHKSNTENLHVLKLEKNVGKAEAIRQGALHALKNKEYEWVGYWDADLATPLEEIHNFFKIIESDSLKKVVFGSRFLRIGSNIKRHWYRHYLGRVFATFASIILKVPIYDTQCGAKLFKRDIAEIIFSKTFLTKWCFDIEIFKRIILNIGAANFFNICEEFPLRTWIDVAGSKIRLSHYLRVPFDLFRIYSYYKRLD